jgi:putative phosphoesterase
MKTLGVIADTHIPDRRRALHPNILPIFEQAGVDVILHAGDISRPRILAQLESLAPVHAVRGNRDIFGFADLPTTRVLAFEQVQIGMAHGHGNWGRYVLDKVKYLLRGPQAFRIAMERALESLPGSVDVVIFGHNHYPMNSGQDGKLIFNPGSPCCPVFDNLPPTIGLLYIDGNQVTGKIIDLDQSTPNALVPFSPKTALFTQA